MSDYRAALDEWAKQHQAVFDPKRPEYWQYRMTLHLAWHSGIEMGSPQCMAMLNLFVGKVMNKDDERRAFDRALESHYREVQQAYEAEQKRAAEAAAAPPPEVDMSSWFETPVDPGGDLSH